MHHSFLLILVLLFIVFLLVMLAQRIRIAYPIFLVIAGLGISFLPGIPRMKLDPEIYFPPTITLRSSLVHFVERFLEMETSYCLTGFRIGISYLNHYSL